MPLIAPKQVLPRGSGGGAGGNPPVPGARKADDGNWYVPDPKRPGKYLKVSMEAP